MDEAAAPDSQKRWIYIAPIANLTFASPRAAGVRVDRVEFINGRMLRRRWSRRYRAKRPLASYLQRPATEGMLDEFDTFAVCHHTGIQAQAEAAGARATREELMILAASELNRTRRQFETRVDVGRLSDERHQRPRLLIAPTESNEMRFHWPHSNWHAMELDERWREAARARLFFPLARILQGKVRVGDGWRSTLRRVAILMGESFTAPDLATAFLRNAIALEILLTEQSDTADQLQRRSRALLGWLNWWRSAKYEEKIRDAYQIRCRLVHQGDNDAVTVESLLFTDFLLANLMSNIVRFPKRFPSKAKLMEFTQFVEAEELLKLRRRDRRRGFYVSQLLYKPSELAVLQQHA